jgi:hypothetical protein
VPSEPFSAGAGCGSSSRSHPRWQLLFSCVLLLFVLSDSAADAQGTPLSKLETQYRVETNPVREAKLLAKLGPLEVNEALKDLKADQDSAAFTVLQRLRDDARQTVDALLATQVNAVRHPAGFKELQIGLRESLRRLNDISFEAPLDKEDQFESLRSDLMETQTSLMDVLFPSSKEKRSKDGN